MAALCRPYHILLPILNRPSQDSDTNGAELEEWLTRYALVTLRSP